MRLLFIILISFLLFSCSSDDKQIALGGRHYGGCLRVSESDFCHTLFPPAITDATSGFVATQVHEGLMKLNPLTLRPVPALAESVEIDPSGLLYSFKLRKGVFFHDNSCFEGGKGRELKAEDVKYSLELLCTASADNQNFSTTLKDRVVGANETYAASLRKEKKPVSGIRVIDDYSLTITLQSPSTVFLQILAEPACAIIPREAVERYGNKMSVGCGPFIMASPKNEVNKMLLLKNNNYYGKDSLGNTLPFLDSVSIAYIPSKENEFNAFSKGELDMVFSIPSNSVKQFVEQQIADFEGKSPKFILDNSAEMTTQYYAFNTQKPPFNNPLVRKAFNLAVNRQKIIDDVLSGQAYGPGVKGITPPTFLRDGYDISLLQGYEFDPVQARKLLAEAGYKDGKNFPAVRIALNAGGGKNTEVVIELQKQFKENLGIQVDFDVVPYEKKFEDDIMGRNSIMRDAWVADFASPETFLNLFYGKTVPPDSSLPSFPNTSRYINESFDRYFSAGRDARTRDSSYANFFRAEQQLLNDAPIIVLWYEGNYRITRSYIKNSFSNAMRYRNFTEVYLQRASETSAVQP